LGGPLGGSPVWTHCNATPRLEPVCLWRVAQCVGVGIPSLHTSSGHTVVAPLCGSAAGWRGGIWCGMDRSPRSNAVGLRRPTHSHTPHTQLARGIRKGPLCQLPLWFRIYFLRATRAARGAHTHVHLDACMHQPRRGGGVEDGGGGGGGALRSHHRPALGCFSCSAIADRVCGRGQLAKANVGGPTTRARGQPRTPGCCAQGEKPDQPEAPPVRAGGATSAVVLPGLDLIPPDQVPVGHLVR
jgi:hypothetical protein